MMAVIKIYTSIKDSVLNAQVIWYRTIYMKFISSLQEENEGVVEYRTNCSRGKILKNL